MSGRLLKIILGPTAVGKTDFSISQARYYSSPVISCDSRQMYREMLIGTAAPTGEQMGGVRHYFIRDRSIDDGIYTAGKYELEAVALIERLFDEGHDTLVMCGGSPFYIDAVCNGLDDFPASDMKLREELMQRLGSEGLESLQEQLHRLDSKSWSELELSNPQRVVRALEVCLMTGRPFSSFKTSPRRKRSFEIEKIGLMRPREELYGRIDERAAQMFAGGLVEEAALLYPKRGLPALQTVGYREIFSMMDGEYGPERALELIQRNTRRYAKRQLSWWRRDPDIVWREMQPASRD